MVRRRCGEASLRSRDEPGALKPARISSNRLVRKFLGETERRSIDARFVYFSDDAEPLVVDSWVTYYDARAGQSQRTSEYRLYYQDNEVTERAAQATF